MHNEDILKVHNSIHREIIDYMNDNTDGITINAFKEDIFTQVMIEYLIDFGAIEGGEVIHFERKTGYGNVKVNGYYLDYEEGNLDIIVSIFDPTSELHEITKGDTKKILERASRLFTLALKSYHKEMDSAHDDYSMLESIFLNQSNIYKKRIILLSNFDVVLNNEEFKLDDFVIDIWDIKRFYKNITSVKGHETINIDFSTFTTPVRCLATDHFSDAYETFLAVIPGQILADLYDRYGSRLLELNVRSFLQAKGKINQNIRNTIKDKPEMFLAYNNGITVVSDNVNLTIDNKGFPIIKDIIGFQIVNGGQTTASLHRASLLGDDLSKISIQAKITIVKEDNLDEIVPLISRYSNSQNTVNEADFSSNSAYHVEIQKLSEQVWLPGDTSRWFYERTRGQYQVQKNRRTTTKELKKFNEETPTNQKITKTDLAKYINSWDQLPHVVSLGSLKNFVHLMNRVKKDYPKDWKPDSHYYRDLIAKAILFKETDKIAKKVGISSYKANVVTYAISYLSYKTAKGLDLGRIWVIQELNLELVEMLEYWIPQISNYIIQTANGRNVTEWCKKEECWKGLKETNLALNANFAALLRDQDDEVIAEVHNGQIKIINNQDEINNAKVKVMQVESDIWYKISKWGYRTGELKEWQCGIAESMGSYATRFWKHKPSAKQAIRASEILDIALNDVLMELNEEKSNNFSKIKIDTSKEMKKWVELKSWMDGKGYLDETCENIITNIEKEIYLNGFISEKLKQQGEQLLSDAYSEGWEYK